MNFPSKSAREENEKVKCVIADVFLCRLVIYLLATNLVVIASGAEVFFWVAGKKGSSYGLDRAVVWLFGDADIDVTACCAIRIQCGEAANTLLCSRGNNTSNFFFVQTLGGPNAITFLVELVKRFLLSKRR